PVGQRGRVLLRRAVPAGGHEHSAEGAVDGGADPAVRGGGAGFGAAVEGAGVHGAAGVVPELPAGPGEARVAVARAGQVRHEAAVAAARAPDEVPAAADAGRDGVPLDVRRACAVALPPGAPVLLP